MEIDNLPKDKKIVLFDGVCNYCNDKINFIIKNDKQDVFRFVALQSETGQKIIKYLGIDNSIDSIINTSNTSNTRILRWFITRKPIASASSLTLNSPLLNTLV